MFDELAEIGRDLHSGHSATLPQLKGLIFDNIDNARHFLAFHHGNGERNDIFTILFLEGVDGLLKARIRLIQTIDQEGHWLLLFLKKAHRFLRTHGDPVFSGEHDEGDISRFYRKLLIAQEVKVTRSIDDVNFTSIPLDSSVGSVDGNAATAFLFVKVADGIAIADFTHAVNGFAVIEHGFQHACFSCSAVSKQNDVADFVYGIGFHDFSP